MEAYSVLLALCEAIPRDNVIKWKHFQRYWPFVRGIHRSLVNSPHTGQWRTLMFSLTCGGLNGWVNSREAGNLRRHLAHYNVIVMLLSFYEGNPPGIDGFTSQCASNAGRWCRLSLNTVELPMSRRDVMWSHCNELRFRTVPLKYVYSCISRALDETLCRYPYHAYHVNVHVCPKSTINVVAAGYFFLLVGHIAETSQYIHKTIHPEICVRGLVMVTSSNGKKIRVTGLLCREFTGHGWILHGAFMFSLINAWTSSWPNNRDAGDLRRHPTHYYVTVMCVCCGLLLVNSVSSVGVNNWYTVIGSK